MVAPEEAGSLLASQKDAQSVASSLENSALSEWNKVVVYS